MSENLLVDDQNQFYCPICKHINSGSDYLKGVFSDQKSLWLANMVMHYRHDHIKWWNNCWGRNGVYYQGRWFKNYDEEKSKVNECAKRQIARKCKDFLINHQFKVSHFKSLQGTTQRTINLVKLILEPDIADLIKKEKMVVTVLRYDYYLNRAKKKFLEEIKQ